MKTVIEKFKKYAPCLLHLDCGGSGALPIDHCYYYIDSNGKSRKLTEKQFLLHLYHVANLEKKLIEELHDGFYSAIVPVVPADMGCSACYYNFDGVCANHGIDDPDTYGTNIADLQIKFPLGCSCFRFGLFR